MSDNYTFPHRLVRVARQYKVLISDIVDILTQNGFLNIINNPNFKISDEQFEFLEKHFTGDAMKFHSNFKNEKVDQEVVDSKQNNSDPTRKIVYSKDMNVSEIYESVKKINEETYSKNNIDYYSWSEKNLFQEMLSHNQVDNLILKGKFLPDKNGRNFGLFIGVKHINDSYLDYPFQYGPIEKVFVFSDKLTSGNHYTFEIEFASKRIKYEKNNPFLIQAKLDSIEKIIQHSQLEILIDEKEHKLDRLKKSIENIETDLDVERNIMLKDAEAIVSQKYQEANETILEKFNEIELKQNEVESLNIEIAKCINELDSLTNKQSTMEASISLLRQKLELCKNLEFISENVAEKYLNVLKTKSFTHPENHLNFKSDFNSDYAKLAEHIHLFLYNKKGLIYTKFQIQNFLSLLMTHDIIVLSGLSGSGKTQIIKSFAEAIGGIAKIIPVKPNWSSSDDLLGYYNPIQSSFLPTPFTEAISEARQNPNQLYLICLDEMNLARAEYYFADFLSKLEEREVEPEIELYAKHEEELFLSEFSTLLSLFENAIKDKNITSWQEFLSEDDVRNRFFELLGSMEQETMLKIHSKMKRRLIDILKFPATLKIPSNIRFIGAINVDETTNYFSPKILDRVHIVKFENPLLLESIVASNLEDYALENELKPVYIEPSELGDRKELPRLNQEENEYLEKFLKEINKKFLLNLSIDFGVRSIRQAINYAKCLSKTYAEDSDVTRNIILNTIINQKILPRFVFDGNESLRNGKTKIELLKRFSEEIETKLELMDNEEQGIYSTGYLSYKYINDLIVYAEANNGQINFYV